MASSPLIAIRPTELEVKTPDPDKHDCPRSPNMRTPGSPEVGEGTLERRHIVEVYKEYGVIKVGELLKHAVADELGRLGVENEVPRVKGGSKARKSPRPGKDAGNNNGGGNNVGLKRTIEVTLPNGGLSLTIPLIIKETCDFIRENIKQQGIFRISGSASRANEIMKRFMGSETQFFTATDIVHDVTTVLKQFLRELELPLIPLNLHRVFLQCEKLEDDDSRKSALILATCLLPPETAGILTYILQFLAEVAENSQENLMTVQNLSKVMGINIMPLDPRKTEKGKDVQNEIGLVSCHNKVIEYLITHVDDVSFLPEIVELRLDSLLTLRSSEDELESEGPGRRRKKRQRRSSGSMTRVMEFLKKVTSSKSAAATPITPMPKTPNSICGTPVIKKSSKKVEMGGIFPVNKNPMVIMAKHQTPNGNPFRGLMTPALLSRRDRNADKKTNEQQSVMSVPTKPSKFRSRFGRSRSQKKPDAGLQNAKLKSVSTNSIHNLNGSPRRVSLTSIPSASKLPIPVVGQKPAVPPKRASLSSSRLRRDCSKASIQQKKPETSSEGDYVSICTTADLNGPDSRNDAFIASSSSISLVTNDEPSQLPDINSKYSETLETNLDEAANANSDTTKDTEDDSTMLEPPPKLEMNLSPLINEIDALTRSAQQELTLSTLRGNSASSIRPTATQSKTLPESPTELNTTPLDTEQVEQKFIKAMKESKITKIQSKNKDMQIKPLQRRLTIQERVPKMGMSPSQKRIASVRRRSHEVGRVTPAITVRFLSLRSPRRTPSHSPVAVGSGGRGSIKRSPIRCTLKRGRPNTTRVGLPRPSPGRAPNRPVPPPPSDNKTDSSSPPPLPPKGGTPMRRMSSVQELVNKLEKKRKPVEKNTDITNTVGSTSSILRKQISGHDKIKDSFEETKGTSITELPRPPIFRNVDPTPKTPKTGLALSIAPEGNAETNWTDGDKFQFERKDFLKIQRSTDRDSIHFLKTLRAGNVPATVEYFNKIGCNKSPTKSMIPRYTALHNKEGSRLSLKPVTPTDNAEGIVDVQSTPRMSRRMSSVDIDIHNRQKKEELLERIKKENNAVKRSNTTAGSYKYQPPRRPAYHQNEKPVVAARPTSLDIRKGITTEPVRTVTARVQSFRRNPTQTPKILEEEESLVALMNKAMENIFNPTSTPGNTNSVGRAKTNTSPLKTSNIANCNIIRNESIKRDTPPALGKSSADYNLRKRNVNLNRTASENGTKSTSSTTPRATPRIKKSLTTRAYDMIGNHSDFSISARTPTSENIPPIAKNSSVKTNPPSSTARHQPKQKGNTPAPSGIITQNQNNAQNCPTVTPRRRVPRMGHGGMVIPHSSESTSTKTPRFRTPLKASHAVTPRN